jgi:hypothetical protein
MSAGNSTADFERNSANISFVRGMVQPISNVAASLDSMTEEQEKHFNELIAVMKSSVRSNDLLEETQKALTDKIAAMIASLQLQGGGKNKDAIDKLKALHKGVGKSGGTGSNFMRSFLGDEFESNRQTGASAGTLVASGTTGLLKSILADFGVNSGKHKEGLNSAVNRHMAAQTTLGSIGGPTRLGGLGGGDDLGYGPGRKPNGTGTQLGVLNLIRREITLIRMVVEGRIKFKPGSKKNAEREDYQKKTSDAAKGRPAMFTNLAKGDSALIEAVKHAIENKGVPMPNKDPDTENDSKAAHSSILAGTKATSDAKNMEADDDDKKATPIKSVAPIAEGFGGAAILSMAKKFFSRGKVPSEVVKATAKVGSTAAGGAGAAAAGGAEAAGVAGGGSSAIATLGPIALLVAAGALAKYDIDKTFEEHDDAIEEDSKLGKAHLAYLKARGVAHAHAGKFSGTPNNSGIAMDTMGDMLETLKGHGEHPQAPQIIPIPTPITQRVVETQTMLPTRPTDNSFLRYLDKRAVRSL